MLPDAVGAKRRVSAGRGLAYVGAALTIVAAAPAAAQDAVERATLSRSLRSAAFVGAELDARHRSAVYAEDAEPGPSGQSTLRAWVYGSGDVGPFGLYLGLGAIARRSQSDATIGDPFRDPYDDFTFGRNVRLLSGFVEYAVRDDDKRRVFTIRAGRLTSFDRSARLLLFDGANLAADFGPARLFVYGGRRASLDGGIADGRTDALAQLVAGAGLRLALRAVDVEATYRLEELHRAILRGAWRPTDGLFVDLSAEARIGGRDAIDTYESVYGVPRDDLGLALVVRHDGSAATTSGSFTVDWRAQVQLGQDPVSFGRGGFGPKDADLQAALGVPLSSATLDRLFLGPQPAHALGDLEVRWWPATAFVIAAGGYTRQPLTEEDRTSLRPGIVEVYGGPEVRVAGQHRVGLEGRLAWEDPGEPGRAFANVGDGERRSGTVRAYAELPFLFGAWRLALRPEGEATIFSSRGPSSVADNQRSFFGGMAAALSYHTDFYTVLRYGGGTLPAFYADGVDVVHDFEITVGGHY